MSPKPNHGERQGSPTPTIEAMQQLDTSRESTPLNPEDQNAISLNKMLYAFRGWSRKVFPAQETKPWYFQYFEKGFQAQHTRLNQAVVALQQNHHSLVVGYENHLIEAQATENEFRDGMGILRARIVEIDTAQKADALTFRRDIQFAERAIRADNVVAAGKALIPDPEEEAKELMRKTIGRSPAIPEQLLKLGNDPKASRVLAVVQGCEQLEAEIEASWTGTIYTTGNQAAISKLVLKKLPATLKTELTFGANPFPLEGTFGWTKFKEQLIQLAMHLDFAGGTPQAWLRNQQQDAQPLNEYVALMSAVTSKLPKQMMADQDVRKSLVNSFIPEVRDLMLRRNAYWVTDRQGGYPSQEEIYRAAYEVADFQKALDANPYSAPDIDQAM